MARRNSGRQRCDLTYIKGIPNNSCGREAARNSLCIGKSFDIEAKSWANTHDVLAIELLEDRGFPCIIKASKRYRVNDRYMR